MQKIFGRKNSEI